MKQIKAPQNSVMPASKTYLSEFDGAEKLPAKKVIDLSRAIIADYKRYEEKMTHISAPIIEWVVWSIIMLITGAAFFWINHTCP